MRGITFHFLNQCCKHLLQIKSLLKTSRLKPKITDVILIMTWDNYTRYNSPSYDCMSNKPFLSNF